MSSEESEQGGDEVETVILRFRDLVTSLGETIKEHEEIANEKGIVYWGWWRKAGEKVPHEVFAQLNSKARSQSPGLEIYLFDSGQYKLYSAICNGIDYHSSKEGPPEVKRTPSYYNERKFLAWFRLTSISEINDDAIDGILNDLTYVRVDDFFESGTSRYDPFYSKRVMSLEELRQQDRTIWFVRTSSQDDPSNEISLLDSKRFEPAHFPKEYRQKQPSKLLWLSDLHFSIGDHHRFPLKNYQDEKTLAHQLEKAVEEKENKSLGGIIVSGDLTWKADPDEYDYAQSFLENCVSWSHLDWYDFLICPGNHDLAFSDDPADKDQPVKMASDVATKGYRELYNQLFFQQPNDYLASGRRYLLGNSFPVEVVGLNSSLLQQEEDLFQGNGFLGDDQLSAVKKEMEWDETDDPRAMRIVVVHHHVIPVNYRLKAVRGRSYSVVLDAEAMIRWALDCKVDLILHGHMHEPFYTELTRPRRFYDANENMQEIAVLGMGSSGVDHDHIDNGKRNLCAVLDFSWNDVRVTYYEISPRGEANEHKTIKIQPPFLRSNDAGHHRSR